MRGKRKEDRIYIMTARGNSSSGVHCPISNDDFSTVPSHMVMMMMMVQADDNVRSSLSSSRTDSDLNW